MNLLLAACLLLLAWMLSSDCKAELELKDSSVSTAAQAEVENPWAVKLSVRRAGVKEKSAKAQAKWKRLKRDMFPRESAEMRFMQRASADGVFYPKAYIQAKESIVARRWPVS
jgi:hypothetical protein